VFSFGFGIYARNILDYMIQNLDNLIVGRVVGIAGLGYYDKAYSTTSLIVSKINLAGPSVSFRIFALIQDEPERFKRAFRKVITAVTVIGYPVLAALIVVGPELIEVLYGAKWRPAALPFQVLCGAAMLRLLNVYASSATQAKGQIWSEVRRQALFTVLLAACVAAGSRWGITGAAAGVLAATSVMTLMLQALTRQVAHLSWADIYAPQLPGAVAGCGLALGLTMVKAALLTIYPSTPVFLAFLLCAGLSALYLLAFLLFSPFAAVREIVQESADDLLPPFVGRWLVKRRPMTALASSRQ
jgi:PST family polysaccharide transporter